MRDDDDSSRPPKNGDDPDAWIKLEAIERLKGADELAKRVASLVNYSLDHLTYNIRYRVKTIDGVANKVKKKHMAADIAEANGTDADKIQFWREYRPEHVRDIIGIRVVSLNRDELPGILKRFFRLLAADDEDQGFEFNAVEEVIHFQRHTPDANFNDQIDEAVNVAQEKFGITASKLPKDSGYTCVHVIVACTLKRKSGEKHRQQIPIEFQFRSALEDIWSEIEHQLEYKARGQLPDAGMAQEFAEHLRQQLPESKRQIDSASDSLDRVKAALNRILFPPSPVPAHENSFRPSRLETALKTISNDAVNASQLFHEALSIRENALDREADTNSYSAILKALEESTIGFERLLRALQPLEKLTKDTNPHFVVMNTKMEIAFNFYRSANLMLKYESIDTGNQKLDDATGIYEDLIRNRIKHTVVFFRLSQCLYLLGGYDEALRLLRDANEHRKEDEFLRDGNNYWIHLRVPSNIGLTLWTKADRILQSSKIQRRPCFGLVERTQLHMDAVIESREATDADLDAFDASPETRDDLEKIRQKARNNTLYYTVSARLQIARAREGVEDAQDQKQVDEAESIMLAFDLDEGQIEERLTQLNGETLEKIRNTDIASRADTIALCYGYLVETSSARDAFRDKLYAATHKLAELAEDHALAHGLMTDPNADVVASMSETCDEISLKVLRTIISNAENFSGQDEHLDMMQRTLQYCVEQLSN